MLGHLHLRFAENILNVADAERSLDEQVEDAQAGFVTEALVDID